MLFFPSRFPSLSVTGRTLSDLVGNYSLVPKIELYASNLLRIMTSQRCCSVGGLSKKKSRVKLLTFKREIKHLWSSRQLNDFYLFSPLKAFRSEILNPSILEASEYTGQYVHYMNAPWVSPEGGGGQRIGYDEKRPNTRLKIVQYSDRYSILNFFKLGLKLKALQLWRFSV